MTRRAILWRLVLWRFSCDRKNSANSRSPGLVIFKLRGDPMTTCTVPPARSIKEASSVPRNPSALASSNAFFSNPKRNPCGVCAITMRSRGTVARTTAPSAVRSTCFTVSMAGIPAMAAPYFLTASITPSIVSSSTNGRTASCTSTMSSGAASSAAESVSDRILPVFSTLHYSNGLLEPFPLPLASESRRFRSCATRRRFRQPGRCWQTSSGCGSELEFPAAQRTVWSCSVRPPSTRRHAGAKSGRGDDDYYFHIGQRSINARRDFFQIAGEKQGALPVGKTPDAILLRLRNVRNCGAVSVRVSGTRVAARLRAAA